MTTGRTQAAISTNTPIYVPSLGARRQEPLNNTHPVNWQSCQAGQVDDLSSNQTMYVLKCAGSNCCMWNHTSQVKLFVQISFNGFCFLTQQRLYRWCSNAHHVGDLPMPAKSSARVSFLELLCTLGLWHDPNHRQAGCCLRKWAQCAEIQTSFVRSQVFPWKLGSTACTKVCDCQGIELYTQAHRWER